MGIRDSEATRQRLVDAARAEFATYGIAGARVDRIAEASRSNKAQIYHYFGSKDRLFDAVWEDLVVNVTEQTPLDVNDLAGYALSLADGFLAVPEYARLIGWQRLERGDDPPHEFAVKSTLEKAQAIAAAQEAGLVSRRFEAPVLLGLLIYVASFWAASSPDILAVMDFDDNDARRAVVRQAVECLLA
jgi:AcrR family transcriptional regulator